MASPSGRHNDRQVPANTLLRSRASTGEPEPVGLRGRVCGDPTNLTQIMLA